MLSTLLSRVLTYLHEARYFDHNASTPIAPRVRKAMEEAICHRFGNASSLHTQGRTSRGLIENARREVASLLDCDPDKIVFTSGGTEANNAAIKGSFLARGLGHIITSKIEHESILGACSQVEQLGGRVTYLPAGPDGRVSPDAVANAITPDTILISLMHANNETGAIQPVAEVARIAAASAIPFHTDAVQSFGKIPFAVKDIGCDFLTLTAHKINGPKGIGALYYSGKAPFLPLVFGGDQERARRAGTEGVHQVAGLGAAAGLARERMGGEFSRLTRLRKRMIDGIRSLAPDAVINEARPDFQLPGTINVTFPGRSGLRILAGLDCYEIGVSIGSACTADRVEPSHVLLGMGISEEQALSTIRISMGTTTSLASVLFFLWALKHVLEHDPPGFAYIDPQHLTYDLITNPNTFMVDVRFPHERLASPSIPGARLWTHFGFEGYIPQIPWDKQVIIMCGTGILSTGAGYRLAGKGHPNTRVVYGGYAAWRALHPDLIDRLEKAGSRPKNP